MLHPNNYRTAPGWNPYRFFGQPDKELYTSKSGQNRGMFLASDMVLTASRPEGGSPHSAWVHPYVSGGMSGTLVVDFTGNGDLLQGGPMTGDGTITFSQDGLLSLITSLVGNGSWILSGDGMELKLTVSLTGDGVWSLYGINSLSLIVPLFGDGSWTLYGISDLRGRLSLIGAWSPYTELSPENLANAVWEALAASHVTTGTMGKKLNDAGSAGDPWETELPGTYEEGTAGNILFEILKLTGHKVTRVGSIITIYEDDELTPWRQYDLANGGRVIV